MSLSVTIDNLPVQLYSLKNKNGVEVKITNYGARITHFIVPHQNKAIDIVLGFDTIEEFKNNNEFYYGVTVGRFANRIGGASFKLNSTVYELEANNGGNSLHSGSKAFHNSVWDVIENSDNEIVLKSLSPDGLGGFPGNLICEVQFVLTDSNELVINYEATSDKDTVVNMTNHAYFNLNGEGNGDVLNHEVKINANHYVPINTRCIPLGTYAEVANTPFDFREFKKIGEGLDFNHQQIKIGKGYDHSFVLNPEADFRLAATAIGDKTGLKLEVYTDQPGMQFYTGNYLGGDVGKSGEVYEEKTGFCFETQHHPDSPNQAQFPSTVLKANEVFKTKTIYQVS